MTENNGDPNIIALNDFGRSLCRLRQEAVWQRVRSGLFVSDEMIASAGLEPRLVRGCEEAQACYPNYTPEQWSEFQSFINSLKPEQLTAPPPW